MRLRFIAAACVTLFTLTVATGIATEVAKDVHALRVIANALNTSEVSE